MLLTILRAFRCLLVEVSQLLINLGFCIDVDFHVTKSERWTPKQKAPLEYFCPFLATEKSYNWTFRSP